MDNILMEEALHARRRSSLPHSNLRSQQRKRSELGIECVEYLQWKDWQPGKKYVKTLMIMNTTKRVQTLRWQPPQSPYFCMEFHDPVRLNPGATVSIGILFRPENLEKHESFVEFSTSKGTFTVSLKGNPPKMQVEMPEYLDFGCCAVKDISECKFQLCNTGEIDAVFQWIVQPPFSFLPPTGTLLTGKTTDIVCRFEPSKASAFKSTALVSLAGSKTQKMELSGVGKYTFLLLSNSSLEFGDVLVGSSRELELVISNTSEVIAKITLRRTEGNKDPDDAVFFVNASEAMIHPKASVTIKVLYSPFSAGASYMEEFEIISCQRVLASFTCSGFTCRPLVKISCLSLDFGSLEPGKSSSHSISLKNYSIVHVSYQFITEELGVFHFHKSKGVIRPRSTITQLIEFRPTVPANYYKRVFCILQDQYPLFCDLIGSCYSGRLNFPTLLACHVYEFRKELQTGSLKVQSDRRITTEFADTRISPLSSKQDTCRQLCSAGMDTMPSRFSFNSDNLDPGISVKPSKGIVEAKSFALVSFKFRSAAPGFCTQKISCALNNSDTEEIEIALIGSSQIPEVKSVDGSLLQFKPAAVGTSVTQVFTLQNPAGTAAWFEWQIPSAYQNIFIIKPTCGLIVGKERLEFRCTFCPEQLKKYQVQVPCHTLDCIEEAIYYDHAALSQTIACDARERFLLLTLEGEGLKGTITIEPEELNLGTVSVGSSYERKVTLCNSSDAYLEYVLAYHPTNFIQADAFCLNLDCPNGIIPARSSKEVMISFEPKYASAFHFEIACKINLLPEQERSRQIGVYKGDKFSASCVFTSNALFPSLLISGVRCEGFSAHRIWNQLQLGLLNHVLSKAQYNIHKDNTPKNLFGLGTPLEFQSPIVWNFGNIAKDWKRLGQASPKKKANRKSVTSSLTEATRSKLPLLKRCDDVFGATNERFISPNSWTLCLSVAGSIQAIHKSPHGGHEFLSEFFSPGEPSSNVQSTEDTVLVPIIEDILQETAQDATRYELDDGKTLYFEQFQRSSALVAPKASALEPSSTAEVTKQETTQPSKVSSNFPQMSCEKIIKEKENDIAIGRFPQLKGEDKQIDIPTSSEFSRKASLADAPQQVKTILENLLFDTMKEFHDSAALLLPMTYVNGHPA